MNKSDKKDSPEFIYRYLEKNPDATFSDYLQDFPKAKCNSRLFGQRKYRFKNTLKGRDRKKKPLSLAEMSAVDEAINKLTYQDSNAFVQEYLSIDVDRTIADLKSDFPECKMKSGTFHSRKHHFKTGKLQSGGPRQYTRRKNNALYMTIWEKDLELMTEIERKVTKDVIRDFVSSVSNTGRVNWQIVELANPRKLELREIAK